MDLDVHGPLDVSARRIADPALSMRAPDARLASELSWIRLASATGALMDSPAVRLASATGALMDSQGLSPAGQPPPLLGGGMLAGVASLECSSSATVPGLYERVVLQPSRNYTAVERAETDAFVSPTLTDTFGLGDRHLMDSQTIPPQEPPSSPPGGGRLLARRRVLLRTIPGRLQNYSRV